MPFSETRKFQYQIELVAIAVLSRPPSLHFTHRYTPPSSKASAQFPPSPTVFHTPSSYSRFCLLFCILLTSSSASDTVLSNFATLTAPISSVLTPLATNGWSLPELFALLYHHQLSVMRIPMSVLHADASFCFSGEAITMRDVNSFLRQGQLIAAENSGREASANDSVSKCPGAGELRPSESVQKGDLTPKKRGRKRKQERISIQRAHPNADVTGINCAFSEVGVTAQVPANNQGQIHKRAKAMKESNSTGRSGPITQQEHSQTRRRKSMPDAPLKVSSAQTGGRNRGRRKKKPILLESERETMPQEMQSQMQAENEKLRMTVRALQNQLEFIYAFAGQGSKNCNHCRIIKDNADELYKKCYAGNPLAVEPVFKIIPIASIHPLSTGRCMNERAIQIDNNREKSSVPFQVEENFNKKELISARINLTNPLLATAPCRTDAISCFEEDSDAECDLCVELTSQTDDSDNLSKEGWKIEEFRSEECVSKQISENLNSLHEKKVEEIRTEDSLSKQHPGTQNDLISSHDAPEEETKNGVKSSANEIDAHGFQEGSGDITQNSCDTFDGGTGIQNQEDGYIDLKCGCTSQKSGDTIGILRLYQNGMLEIYCQCCSGCMKGKPMSPSKFEKHGGRGSSKKWRESIWVVLGDRKVAFSKVKGLDAFVRRYKESGVRIRQGRAVKAVYHRDEFVQCIKCLKNRRFSRKNKEECRFFHDASMNPEWECSMHPLDRSLSCQDDEEREVRQANRGCIQSRSCQGCIHCICLGCLACRFVDCSCQICQEFMSNYCE